MYMTQKARKKNKIRHAEYYDMQKVFDNLYADSQDGEIFGHLIELISAPNNIKLAFRNIKSNDGSHTAGTDGRTIESLAAMPEEKFVNLIQKQFRRYKPKAVRRVEIPKPNGKLRPLGIPCIIDRIVQQCILQVMEPICEAKFYEHSYGFRPFTLSIMASSITSHIDILSFFLLLVSYHNLPLFTRNFLEFLLLLEK